MRKTTFREIRKSLGRYLAILAIIALGVGFFAGLRVIKEAMLSTGNEYFTEHALYDFRLLSTLGFEQEDLETIRQAPQVRAAEGVQDIDFIALDKEGAETVLKAHSVTKDVNNLILVDGKLPENSGECVVDRELGIFQTGDILKISDSNKEETLESFSGKSFVVVGVVQSPLYINYERGSTTLGNGKLAGFVYFPESSFTTDYYTDIYVKYDSDYMIYSQEYLDYIAAQETEMQELCDGRAEIRYGHVYDEAGLEIADGERELADAQQELADAGQELADAAEQIREGKAELAEKKQELTDAQLELVDGEKELNDGRQKIADARVDLADGEAEFEKGKSELEDNRNLLSEAGAKVQKGRLTYEENLAVWKDGKSQMDDSKKVLDENSAKLKAGWEQYQQGVQMLEAVRAMQLQTEAGYQESLKRYQELQAKPELTAEEQQQYALLSRSVAPVYQALTQAGITSPSDSDLSAIVTPMLNGMEAGLTESKAVLDTSQAQFDAGMQQFLDARKTLEDGKNQLDYALVQLEKGELEYHDGMRQLEEGQKKLEDAKSELEQGKRELADAEAELADGEQKLVDARAQIKDGLVKIADAEQELADAQLEYEDGKKEYDDAKAEADVEIADAQQKLTDAKKELADLKHPDYYVLGRDTNTGYVTFESNADIVQGISSVFPVFFLLVAALVCMTTMNRMVEEQRTQIGIFKALGYSEPAIMSKYMIYSGSAALIGCTVGFVLGSWMFPIFIWKAYAIMYSFADSLNFIFNLPLFVLSLLASLLCACGTTYFSCRHELASVAAELIRPKAPKNGKRILLERIPFVWNRLKFLYKVSIRNVVRYKKRFFMMVLGIGGCSALLLTGYGVKDSVANVAVRQYSEVLHYDLTVILQNEFTGEESSQFTEDTKDLLTDAIFISEESADVEYAGGAVTVSLIVPEEEERIESFIDLHTAKGEKIAYPEKGEVVLTEKTAEKLEVRPGDSVVIRDADNQTETELKVSGIAENFIFNYAYINAESYEQGFAKAIQYKNIYGKIAEEKDPEEVAAAVLDMENVASATANTVVEERFNSMMSSLDYVVILVIACAGALAFIVLYNLTNINITERIREIATIKVLGFYPMETAAYVFRENMVLAAIGAFAGLPLGFLLHRFVMANISIDEIMFSSKILPMSYFYSILLTFLFAILVNVFMFFKLQKINMAESLKSIE